MAEEKKRKPERSRPSVYDWENQLVIVYYTGGPLPDSPFEIETGSLDSRSGVFGLDEVSDLGLMVRKVGRGKGDNITYDHPVFIPWASVHFVERLDDFVAGLQEREQQR